MNLFRRALWFLAIGGVYSFGGVGSMDVLALTENSIPLSSLSWHKSCVNIVATPVPH